MDQKDLGFETEQDLISFLAAQRDTALLYDESDDVVSSFVQDLSFNLSEIVETIAGSELYCEYVSSEATNELTIGDGYEVEATIISEEISYIHYTWINPEGDEDFDVKEWWNSARSDGDLLLNNEVIVLNPNVDMKGNSIFSSLVLDEDWYDYLKVIPVGFPVHGLNWGVLDLGAEYKFVFRLFGKVSGRVQADSASEAKTIFANFMKESFSFIEISEDNVKNQTFADGREFETMEYGPDSSEEAWLIPIERVFVKIRYPDGISD